MDVGWKCAKEPVVIGPGGRPGPPASPSPGGATGGHRAISSIFWGGLQRNVTPPLPRGAPVAPGSPPTPANCRTDGMRSVKVTRNFGYSLLTVVTLGFCSRMQVVWECVP
jgi:hypothetical protein